jgi:hypothetical protein
LLSPLATITSLLTTYHYKTTISYNTKNGTIIRQNINIYIFPDILKTVVINLINKLNSITSPPTTTPKTTKSSNTQPTSQTNPQPQPTPKREDCRSFWSPNRSFYFYVDTYTEKNVLKAKNFY